jgi:RNA polymerase sigma-70 factor (ECF subfamily)
MSVDEMPGTDSSLLTAARRGDEAAFLDLYHRYRTPLFRFAWRLTGSTAAAEDVTQECFLAILSGASFDSRQGALRPYLFGITRNLALKKLHISQREAEEMEDAGSDLDPLGDLLAAERSQAVARAIAALPPLQREALILFEYEDLSLEEIAVVSEIEIGAVKARLHRAREALRKHLAPLLAPSAERSWS